MKALVQTVYLALCMVAMACFTYVTLCVLAARYLE